MKCRRLIAASLAALVIAAPAAIGAQGLSVDVSAGRLVYDPLVANIGTNNLMGSLRYDTAREAWIYGAAAVPLTDGATFWGGAGAGGRGMDDLERPLQQHHERLVERDRGGLRLPGRISLRTLLDPDVRPAVTAVACEASRGSSVWSRR